MAALVSHAMHRFPTSPPDAVYSSYGLRSESTNRHPGDVSNTSSPSGTTGALSRSMRYADPWLYGSVRASGGLLLAPALVLCQCPEYLTGSRRSSSKKSPHACKKCKGTRFPISPVDSKFGTVRCYPTSQQISPSTPLRVGTVRVTSSSRPSILPTADPYDLMRRSRLSVPETSLNTSPFRDLPAPVNKDCQKNSSGKSTKQESSYNSTYGRRSILECNVNPYDLMTGEKLAESKHSKEVKPKNVTSVNGQRIRVRPVLDTHQNREEVPKHSNAKVLQSQVTQGKLIQKKQTSVKLIPPVQSPVSPVDKDPEHQNRFKSILKKPNYNGDSSAYSDLEDAVSPTSPRKSGSKFYLPVPLPVTPRKKVQFLDAAKSDTSEDEDRFISDKSNNENLLGYYEDPISIKEDRKMKTIEIQNEDEDEEVFEDALENPEPENEPNKTEASLIKRPCKVNRSNSDRRNKKESYVNFFDTTALRTRKRNDCRIVFTEQDLEKLDGLTARIRKISPRPTSPPPPPPTVDPPKEKEIDFLTDKKEDKPLHATHVNDGHITNETSAKHTSEGKKEEHKHKISISSTSSDEATNLLSTPPSAPPRKRSNNKQPIVNIVTHSISTSTVKIESPIVESPSNKTVVQISSPLSDIHKIQIKNEPSEYSPIIIGQSSVSIFENAQRKTSILINGDDCYSTVNVNDDVPLYHSSVVVNDEVTPLIKNARNNSSKIYITGEISTNTDTEKVLKQVSEQLSTLTTDKDTEPPPIPEPKAELLASQSELLKELLRDPVEAVRHNLVPHVCGKSDMVRRQRDTKFPRHRSPLSKPQTLLESPLEEKNLSSSVEDSILRLRDYEQIPDDACSNSSQYELMDQGSECYTDHSNRSSVTEEELENRNKFYELLAERVNIEVSETDDHHYESIKANNDPIYEEIDVPPPLPSNPPPTTILDDLHLDKEYTTRSIFEGASKYDILSYLVDAKERGVVQEDGYTYAYPPNTSHDDDTKEFNRASHLSTVSDSSEDNSLIISGALIDEKATFQKPAEVERHDSGVGSETSKSSLSKYRTKPEIFITCEDCDTVLDSKTENEPLLCRKCVKKRSERKEIITEIVETEEKYSRDLQIILEEFYQPMLVAGLLTPDQLSAIFLNVEELLENSQALAERLRDAVEIALEQGDDDLLTVNIGKLFLEAAPMLHAFETYCIRQGTASLLLASLEKEKELLRIFLRVSQMENTMLRRMNLNSFLMVPVQRVTKYPLLLARLFKVTPTHHDTKELLKEAQHKIELHLNHMNSETKDVPSKLWRRIGSSGRRPSTEMDLVNIKLRKIAVDVLEWNHEEARFILEGKLLFTQPTDNNWRKGRTIKLIPVNAMLVINGKTPSVKAPTDKLDESGLVFSMKNVGVREAALLLVRDKNGRYSLLREPLYLDRCVIAADPAWQSYFEVQELLSKDTFIFKAEDEDQTHVWYRKLQYHAQGMGAWRKRRNALANIMINGMGLRS